MCKKLSPNLHGRYGEQHSASHKKGLKTLARARSSELEYYTCKIYFSSKDKEDKRDEVEKKRSKWAAHDYTGGLPEWIHAKVLIIMEEMLAYGGGGATGEPKSKKQKKA